MMPLAISLSAVWGKVWPIGLAILFFGVLILSHELGHFLSAKAFKIRVTEFAMGMGPKLLSFGKGETKYVVKLLPFGGSCMMDEDVEHSDDPRAFINQKPWKRFIVLAAGAIVNILCGVLIAAVMLGSAALQPDPMHRLIGTPVVRASEAGSLTYESGLREGDVFKKIGSHKVFAYMDIRFLLSRDSDRIVDLTVERDGQEILMRNFAFATGEYEDGTKGYAQDFLLLGVPVTFGNTVKYAAAESLSMSRLVYLSLLDMIGGKFSLRDISGPVGVVNIITEQAQDAQAQIGQDKAAALDALQNLLFLCALISINIGLMNLLPIPALDGGRLLFTLIEMIIRKPVPRKFEAYVHAGGMAVLMLFMVLITFKDIVQLFQK
ncbi:MAG: RIP metalloprotease [Oscillospiraceae bacterium]|jgi:regulator of sigma E protease|nr:RIP metalloprotease [Oscillospiraceae bacterium]